VGELNDSFSSRTVPRSGYFRQAQMVFPLDRAAHNLAIFDPEDSWASLFWE
jgi:hypothetical protein